jgi:Phytanoyl-CoA dioxygenase (PhyH)
LAAELIGWEGVRLLQDNCIWKPPGTKSLGMHQDGSYLDYLVPPEMITCWIALDDTAAEAGTITYAAGSHRWPRSPENRGEFHAPDDWLAPVNRAVPEGEEIRLVPIEVKGAEPRFITSTRFTGRARTPRPFTGAPSSRTSCAQTRGFTLSTPIRCTRATGESTT